MPDTFCSSCKKTTSHKEIMCRVDNNTDSSMIRNVQQWFAHLLRGAQYYHMEPKYICRVCNQSNVRMQVLVNPLVINKEEQPTFTSTVAKKVNAN